MTTAALGTAIIAMLGFWLLGGILLRLGGTLFILAGALALATTGNADGLGVVALGAALRLVGHWHYQMRHRV
jgi:hypothetical protein